MILPTLWPPNQLNIENPGKPEKTPGGPNEFHITYHHWLKQQNPAFGSFPHELLPHLKNKQYLLFPVNGTYTRKCYNLQQAITHLRKTKTLYKIIKLLNPNTGDTLYLIRAHD